MTSKDLLEKKMEKYFFTANIFDEDVEEVEVEPPPPIFSERELEDAKKRAFEEGKKAGFKESEESISKKSFLLLENISRDTGVLFEAEEAREKNCEREAIRLSLAIFAKLFPLYAEKQGFEEFKHALGTILAKQHGQNHISISVSSGEAATIESFIANIATPESGLKLVVKGDETLLPGACRLSWQEGGAQRDPHALADEIRETLEQMLAASGTKGHDDMRNPVTGDDGEAT